MATPRKKLTLPAVAESLGVNPRKVRFWIEQGELRAYNLASSKTGRPRYAIDPMDLQTFEASRQVTPTPSPISARSSRRPQANEVTETEYF